MKVAIHQPAYLPWLGYFEKIARVDQFIILDTVQFEKNSFDNRNRIRTGSESGWQWLTVPIKKKGKFGNNNWLQLTINDETSWSKKHFETLRHHYGKCPYWKDHAPFLESVYNSNPTLLFELNHRLLLYFLEVLEIRTPLVRASTLSVQGAKAALVLSILKEVGATAYYSGSLGRDYLDPIEFEQGGIALTFQDYRHPTYSQHYPGFVPQLSILDLLMNHGPKSRSILLEKSPSCVSSSLPTTTSAGN